MRKLRGCSTWGLGLGSLTLGLLDSGAEVVAVEIDGKLAGLLPSTVVEGDALRLESLAAAPDGGARVEGVWRAQRRKMLRSALASLAPAAVHAKVSIGRTQPIHETFSISSFGWIMLLTPNRGVCSVMLAGDDERHVNRHFAVSDVNFMNQGTRHFSPLVFLPSPRSAVTQTTFPYSRKKEGQHAQIDKTTNARRDRTGHARAFHVQSRVRCGIRRAFQTPVASQCGAGSSELCSGCPRRPRYQVGEHGFWAKRFK